MRQLVLIAVLFFGVTFLGVAQDLSLVQQFNGRYDYTAIGNTLNPGENNIDQSFCSILSSSEATLSLNTNQTIVAAYLYWAGSGLADTEVVLNGYSITAAIDYSVSYPVTTGDELLFFSCVADVTNLVQTLGNTSYQFSELDISEALNTNPGYCTYRTNFAGWSIYVVYADASLPINQVSLFQGLEIINRDVTEKTILLENIHVLSTDGAKIGFLTWEGDANLAVNETVSVNDVLLSNPPLNPETNAFNGTNSFTNSSTFYNADLDVYDLQNHITIGDTSAEIKLTTGADLIIINNIITVLNSQLPDATVVVEELETICYSQEVFLTYTVHNANATRMLPAGTPLAIYADSALLFVGATENDLEIDASETATVVLEIPESLPLTFELLVVVDDDGTGEGIVLELDEENNTAVENIVLSGPVVVEELPSLLACDTGLNTAVFDLTLAVATILEGSVSLADCQFFTTLENLLLLEDELGNPAAYSNQFSEETMYIRVAGNPCAAVCAVVISTENCPPIVPQGFSPNGDGYNDWFHIQGLYDVFEEHQLLVYNRLGTLVFEGDNSLPWEGLANRGMLQSEEVLPVGTYYYVLHLNDAAYAPLTGWVYLNK